MTKNNTVLDQIVCMAERANRLFKSGETERAYQVCEDLGLFVENVFPSGSGFDCGTALESATATKVVLRTEFHHMNETGYYTNWTSHKVVIKATINSYDMKITGKNQNDIKDVIADYFTECCDMDMNDVRMPMMYQNTYYNFYDCSWVKRAGKTAEASNG